MYCFEASVLKDADHTYTRLYTVYIPPCVLIVAAGVIDIFM